MNNVIENKPLSKIINIPQYKTTWAIVTFAVLFTLLFLMLNNGSISELSFVVLMPFVTIFAFVVLFVGKITNLKYKDFQITLQEMKDTEASVKTIALLTANALDASRVKNIQFDPDSSVLDPYPDEVKKLREYLK